MASLEERITVLESAAVVGIASSVFQLSRQLGIPDADLIADARRFAMREAEIGWDGMMAELAQDLELTIEDLHDALAAIKIEGVGQ